MGGALAPPQVSVIVPVYNGAATLGRCLEALARSQGVSWECIVVDDGSTDQSAELARAQGARVVRAGTTPGGPARARNLGVAQARGSLVCFIDADVLVRPDTLARFVRVFEADPALAAAFGSYDDSPDAPGVLSQYRNLLHHFVHQTARPAASTFWAGCGAIRRDVFLAVGGFDPAYRRPCIEDIELGYRLRGAGHAILLAKEIHVTHLKRWTLWGILQTDIRDRALPWTALIMRSRSLPNDLNLNAASRVSAVSVFALAALLVLGWMKRPAWLAAALPLGALLGCNRGLYLFFLRKRGLWFTLRVLPVHGLYYAYSALAFAYGAASYRWQRLRQDAPGPGPADRRYDMDVPRAGSPV
jgi:glycosyltransferase involved in cell wall biosynthesis